MVPAQKHRSMEQDRKPEINSPIHGHLIHHKRRQKYTPEKRESLQSLSVLEKLDSYT